MGCERKLKHHPDEARKRLQSRVLKLTLDAPCGVSWNHCIENTDSNTEMLLIM